MRIKMILGIIAIMCGIGLFAFSGYIAQQVAAGRAEIRSGQQKINAGQEKINSAKTGVNTTNNLIDETTQLKGLGGLLTSPVQEEINSGQAKVNAGKQKIKEGTLKVNYYDSLVGKLKIGGVVMIVIGIILLAFALKRGK